MLHAALQEEQKQLDVPRKMFMTTIRHALTGMKASTSSNPNASHIHALCLLTGRSRYR